MAVPVTVPCSVVFQLAVEEVKSLLCADPQVSLFDTVAVGEASRGNDFLELFHTP